MNSYWEEFEEFEDKISNPNLMGCGHGLRTPNEGINQRKFGLMWQTKYALVVPKNLGVGVDFRLFSEGDFLSEHP